MKKFFLVFLIILFNFIFVAKEVEAVDMWHCKCEIEGKEQCVAFNSKGEAVQRCNNSMTEQGYPCQPAVQGDCESEMWHCLCEVGNKVECVAFETQGAAVQQCHNAGCKQEEKGPCRQVSASSDSYFCVCKKDGNEICQPFQTKEAADDGCLAVDGCDQPSSGNCPSVGGSAPAGSAPAPSGKSLESLKGTGEGQIGSLNKTGIWNLNAQGLATLFGEFSSFFLGIIGSMTFVLYIWAGAIWMTAAGRSEKIEFAQRVIIWTTLAVVAILASYIVVSFAFKTLTGG